jgi:hypothetical protein
MASVVVQAFTFSGLKEALVLHHIPGLCDGFAVISKIILSKKGKSMPNSLQTLYSIYQRCATNPSA